MPLPWNEWHVESRPRARTPLASGSNGGERLPGPLRLLAIRYRVVMSMSLFPSGPGARRGVNCLLRERRPGPRLRGSAECGGVGADVDGIGQRPHILMSTHKEWTIASLFAIERLVLRALPMGRDTVLGLEDDCSAGLFFTTLIPDAIESAVIQHCIRIRASTYRDLD